MDIIKTDIEGLVILEPKIFLDERGYFFESYNANQFNEVLEGVKFVQDNESYSKYGTLRGLHFQKGDYAQAKLIRVIRGKVLDIAVDIRKKSPTYGKHTSVELSGENKRQLFIPRGFAHGFLVLSEEVIFSYKCDNLYSPNHEGTILWSDKQLDIDWKIPYKDIILSEKDTKAPLFNSI